MSRYTFILLCFVLLLTGCPPQRQPIFQPLSKYAGHIYGVKGTPVPTVSKPPQRPYIIIGMVSFLHLYDHERNLFYEEDDSLVVMEKLATEAFYNGAEAITFEGLVPQEYLEGHHPSIPYGRGDKMQVWVTAYAIKWADQGDVEALLPGTNPRPVADSLMKIWKRS